MNHPIMKCTRWQSQLLIRLICVPAAMLFFVLSAHAQTDATLPPVGGPGGNAFVARCQQDRFLTGFELRAGDTVDAIRPICVAAYGPNEIGPLQPYPSKFGGDGGGIQQLVCPSDVPIVIKMEIGWAGKEIFSVSYIGLFCGVASTTQTPSEFPTVKFYEPFQDSSRDILGVPHSMVKRGAETESCPPGRAGKWLDAVGLICGVPKLTPKPIALGRVQPTSPPGPPMSICARARAARARNSPTAPALEAQCRAAGAAGETVPTARPKITAAQNPVVVPNGQTSGTTTISWKAAPDYTYSEIYLSVDNGEWSEFARGSDGAKSMTIKLGSSYTFRMMVYEGQAGTRKSSRPSPSPPQRIKGGC